MFSEFLCCPSPKFRLISSKLLVLCHITCYSRGNWPNLHSSRLSIKFSCDYSKLTRWKIICKISNTYSQLENVYTKRFMTNLRSQRFMEEKTVIGYLSMRSIGFSFHFTGSYFSLTRLQLIFYVFLVLISFSFIGFVSELLYYRFVTRKSTFSR